METKNVSLPSEQVEYIDAKIASGEYAHASEVVRDAVRLMMDEEARKLDWLRRAIQEGIDSAKRGGATELNEAELAHIERAGRTLYRKRHHRKPAP